MLLIEQLATGGRRIVRLAGVYESQTPPISPVVGLLWLEIDGSGNPLYPEVGFWRWTGSYWLSTQGYWMSFMFLSSLSLTSWFATPLPRAGVTGSLDLFFGRGIYSFFIQGTNNSTNKWSIQLYRRNLSNVNVAIWNGSTHTGVEVGDYWYTFEVNLNIPIDVSAMDARSYGSRIAANGSPGLFFGAFAASVFYKRTTNT